MKYALGLLAILGAALAGCGTAHGGGTMGSADLNASHKSTFGFSYRCDAASETLSGVFNYQDHGTGHRFTGKINEQLTQVACGDSNLYEVGVTGACGVVTKGAGGVATGDLIVVGTLDGSLADPATDNAVAVAIFHPPSPLNPNALLADVDCAAVVDGAFGEPVYVNESVLNNGNIIASY